jgi:hypothetical protein
MAVPRCGIVFYTVKIRTSEAQHILRTGGHVKQAAGRTACYKNEHCEFA